MNRSFSKSRRWDPISRIVLWQSLGFFLLIVFTWADALVDMTGVYYRLPPAPHRLYRAAVLTAAIFAVAFITVATTLIQQKKILKGLLRVCSYCRRVQVNEETWRQLEEFLTEKTLAEFTHGVCPECYQREIGKIDA